MALREAIRVPCLQHTTWHSRKSCRNLSPGKRRSGVRERPRTKKNWKPYGLRPVLHYTVVSNLCSHPLTRYAKANVADPREKSCHLHGIGVAKAAQGKERVNQRIPLTPGHMIWVMEKCLYVLAAQP